MAKKMTKEERMEAIIKVHADYWDETDKDKFRHYCTENAKEEDIPYLADLLVCATKERNAIRSEQQKTASEIAKRLNSVSDAFAFLTALSQGLSLDEAKAAEEFERYKRSTRRD